jgi:hypothetical protein
MFRLTAQICGRSLLTKILDVPDGHDGESGQNYQFELQNRNEKGFTV